MNTWKEAIWIAKFEWRKSWFGTLCLFSAMVVMLFSFSWILDAETRPPSLLNDIVFLLLFGCVPFLFRSKELQLQKVEGDVWGSPFFMMLNMLPITKDVLIKSRFVCMLFPSLPFQLLFFILYSINLLESLDIMEYIAFSIIWIAFGVTVSFTFALGDVGERYNAIMLYIYSFSFYVGVTFLLVWLNMKTEAGIVGWTMIAAKNSPILSVFISITVTVGSYYLSKYLMKKKIVQIDYIK